MLNPDSRRVALECSEFVAARLAADAGVPLAFVRRAGCNTVADIPATCCDALAAAMDAAGIPCRFARHEPPPPSR